MRFSVWGALPVALALSCCSAFFGPDASVDQSGPTGSSEAVSRAMATATINWTSVRQTIDGFGASDAWYSDEIMNHPDREQIMDLLFSTTSGAGLSILRHRIDPGLCTAPGVYDWTDSDFQGNVWTAQEAIERGANKIWSSSWTPPSWMKTNNSEKNGGYLKAENYQDYADFLQAYYSRMKNTHGITEYAISPQNEPGIKSWESCEWTNTAFRDFIMNNLGPVLGTRIVAPEETNWDNVDNFILPTINDATAKGYLDIVAGHVYGGNPDTSYNSLGKTTWETEWSYDTSAEDLTIGNGVTWAYNFHRLLANAEVSATHHWWAASFKNDGKQQGLVNAVSGQAGTVVVPKRLWTIGNYSRFVRPGYVRIDATKNPYSNIYMTAYKNPSTNKFAIVVINKGTSSVTLDLTLSGFTSGSVTPYRTSSTENLAQLSAISGGGVISVTLPASTVTTYVGTGTASGGGDDLSGYFILKNKAQNRYLDTSANGVVQGQTTSTGLDKQWRFVASGAYYNIDCAETGRGVLDTGGSGSVTWKTTEPVVNVDGQLWTLERVAAYEYRFKNKYSGRYYLSCDASGVVTWNTGGTGNETIWILSRP